jgi:hypothetical protein
MLVWTEAICSGVLAARRAAFSNARASVSRCYFWVLWGLAGRRTSSAESPSPPIGVKAYPSEGVVFEHRAGAEQQLVQQEAESRHRLNLDREKVLTRLWEIAYLSPEQTRGSVTGQVKAISMIVAIQGLIPDRRASASKTQHTAPPVKAEIYKAEWLRKQQDQSANEQPADPVVATEARPGAPQVPEPEPPRPLDRNIP